MLLLSLRPTELDPHTLSPKTGLIGSALRGILQAEKKPCSDSLARHDEIIAGNRCFLIEPRILLPSLANKSHLGSMFPAHF